MDASNPNASKPLFEWREATPGATIPIPLPPPLPPHYPFLKRRDFSRTVPRGNHPTSKYHTPFFPLVVWTLWLVSPYAEPAQGQPSYIDKSHASLPLGVVDFVIGVREREFFIENLLVRIHLIIEMILGDRPCAMEV